MGHRAAGRGMKSLDVLIREPPRQRIRSTARMLLPDACCADSTGRVFLLAFKRREHRRRGVLSRRRRGPEAACARKCDRSAPAAQESAPAWWIQRLTGRAARPAKKSRPTLELKNEETIPQSQPFWKAPVPVRSSTHFRATGSGADAGAASGNGQENGNCRGFSAFLANCKHRRSTARSSDQDVRRISRKYALAGRRLTRGILPVDEIPNPGGANDRWNPWSGLLLAQRGGSDLCAFRRGCGRRRPAGRAIGSAPV